MDPVEAAQAMIQTMEAGEDITPHLREGVHFRSDAHDVLDAAAVAKLMVDRLGGMGTRFVPGEIAMKRNLVFVWFSFQDLDGKAVARGTWILSMDRDGRVSEWQEFAG